MTMTITQTTNSHIQGVGVPPTTPEAHQRATGSDFKRLMAKALSEPGILSEAYSRFHRFSMGNQVLAAIHLQERGMDLAPIASFRRWEELGRKVVKGAKALALFMPISVQQKQKNDVTGEEELTGKMFTHFMLKRNWFSLEQTEGTEYLEPLAIPTWDAVKALELLNVSEQPFQMVNGNVQGYALERRIAVSPLAALPEKTRFHELAHVVLGHTVKAGCWDAASLPRHIEEAEAECVAFLLCSLLNLPGLAEARGYIQSWLAGQELPERSAQRIFNAAQTILAAGRGE